MNFRILKLILGVLSFIKVITINPVLAQTLDINLYAGITITGSVNKIYAVQTTTNLVNSNSWQTIAIITLPTSSYLYVDTNSPANRTRFYRTELQFTTTNMIYIFPGAFVMGSSTNEVDRFGDEIKHTVTLTRGFYIGKYLVRQSDYLSLIETNPSYFTPSNGYIECTLDCPVESVTWYDASNYCYQFTQQERVAGRLASGWQYRLPTEAEWEYACRAGTTNRFSYGDDLGYTNLSSYGWWFDNGDLITHPVGFLKPNPWGLYDVHGNVWEWCNDWYGMYPDAVVINPGGPTNYVVHRVIRGGYYFSPGGFCRSSQRASMNPTKSDHKTGFRIVMAPILPYQMANKTKLQRQFRKTGQ